MRSFVYSQIKFSSDGIPDHSIILVIHILQVYLTTSKYFKICYFILFDNINYISV